MFNTEPELLKDAKRAGYTVVPTAWGTFDCIDPDGRIFQAATDESLGWLFCAAHHRGSGQVKEHEGESGHRMIGLVWTVIVIVFALLALQLCDTLRLP